MNKIEVYEREDGRFAWRLIAQNGQIIATDGGQGYERLAFAEEMARKTVVTAFPIFTEEIQADGLEADESNKHNGLLAWLRDFEGPGSSGTNEAADVIESLQERIENAIGVIDGWDWIPERDEAIATLRGKA